MRLACIQSATLKLLEMVTLFRLLASNFDIGHGDRTVA